MNSCYTTNCGTIYATACAFYTGTALAGISIPSPVPLDSILQTLAQGVSDLKSSLDMTALDKSCFAFNPATGAQKIFFQEVINKICAIETEIGTLQAQLSGIGATVLNTPIPATIDLKCLLSNPNPCGSVYTLGQILQLIINKIC